MNIMRSAITMHKPWLLLLGSSLPFTFMIDPSFILWAASPKKSQALISNSSLPTSAELIS